MRLAMADLAAMALETRLMMEKAPAAKEAEVPVEMAAEAALAVKVDPIVVVVAALEAAAEEADLVAKVAEAPAAMVRKKARLTAKVVAVPEATMAPDLKVKKNSERECPIPSMIP